MQKYLKKHTYYQNVLFFFQLFNDFNDKFDDKKNFTIKKMMQQTFI